MNWLEQPDPEESNDQGGDKAVSSFPVLTYSVPVLLVVFVLGRLLGFGVTFGVTIYFYLMVNLFAIRNHWQLRTFYWFWLAILFVMALEMPIVLMVKWPHYWVPAVALIPVLFAGYLIASGAIQLAEKLFGKPILEEDE
jgi:hypothetical protein